MSDPIEILETLGRRAQEAAEAADQWNGRAKELAAKSEEALRKKASETFGKMPPLSTIQRDAEKHFGLHLAAEYAREMGRASHLEGVAVVAAITEERPSALKASIDSIEAKYSTLLKRLESANITSLKRADVEAAQALAGACAAREVASPIPAPTLTPAARRVIEVARATHGGTLEGDARAEAWASDVQTALEKHLPELARLRIAQTACHRSIDAARQTIEQRHIREHQARQPQSGLQQPIGSPWTPTTTAR